MLSNQALRTLLSSVAAELALAGHGAMLSSLEERNTAAARTYQVLPLANQGPAVLTMSSVEVYVTMCQRSFNAYGSKIAPLNIFNYNYTY